MALQASTSTDKQQEDAIRATLRTSTSTCGLSPSHPQGAVSQPENQFEGD